MAEALWMTGHCTNGSRAGKTTRADRYPSRRRVRPGRDLAVDIIARRAFFGKDVRGTWRN